MKVLVMFHNILLDLPISKFRRGYGPALQGKGGLAQPQPSPMGYRGHGLVLGGKWGVAQPHR